jgi:hypothetical protein
MPLLEQRLRSERHVPADKIFRSLDRMNRTLLDGATRNISSP